MADSSTYGSIDSEGRRGIDPSVNLLPESQDVPKPQQVPSTNSSLNSIVTIPYLGPMILMPSSLAVAVYLVFFHPSNANATHLFWSLCGIGLFYAGWTIYKKLFQGDKQDLGHFTMGFLAFASFMQWPLTTLVAASIIWLNYALVFYFAFVKFNSTESLARAAKQSTAPVALVWAWVFRSYICLNLVFWCLVVVYKLLPLVRDPTM